MWDTEIMGDYLNQKGGLLLYIPVHVCRVMRWWEVLPSVWIPRSCVAPEPWISIWTIFLNTLIQCLRHPERLSMSNGNVIQTKANMTDGSRSLCKKVLKR